MVKLKQSIRPLEITDNQRIIKSHDYYLYCEIKNGQAKAQEMIEQAQQEAIRIKQTAHDEGIVQGLKQADDQVVEKLLSLTKQYADYIAEVEQQLPNTVLSMIQRVFADFDNGEKLAGMAHQTLSQLRQSKTILIKTAMEDHELFFNRLYELLGDSQLKNYLEIVKDNSLLSGQCHIEFENGLYLLNTATLLEQFQSMLS